MEKIKMIMLNRANGLLVIANISSGGISRTVIDIRNIIQFALNANASAVIIAYKHPSGNLNPSLADIEFTRNITAGLDLFNIRQLDHLILTSERESASIMESL